MQKRNHLGLLLAIWLLSFSGIVPRYMAGGQYNQKWAAYFWARNSTTQYYIVCYRVSSKTKRALTMLILYERCLLYEKIWTLFLPPNTNRKMRRSALLFFKLLISFISGTNLWTSLKHQKFSPKSSWSKKCNSHFFRIRLMTS